MEIKKMSDLKIENPEVKWPPAVIYIVGIVGLIYLLNPTAGVFEIIPDNLPIIGNLDEGAAALLIWNAFRQYRSMRKSS
jgi:uncharacterized membrane protein YkvA (DUF1232 family)